VVLKRWMHLEAHYVFLLVTIDRTPKRLNDHAFVLHDCLKSGHSLASLIRICDRHCLMQKGVEFTVCKTRLIPVFAGSVDPHKKTCTPKGRCAQSVVENGYFAQSFQKAEPAGTTRFTLIPASRILAAAAVADRDRTHVRSHPYLPRPSVPWHRRDQIQAGAVRHIQDV
jgi:hypothetical protein